MYRGIGLPSGTKDVYLLVVELFSFNHSCTSRYYSDWRVFSFDWAL